MSMMVDGIAPRGQMVPPPNLRLSQPQVQAMPMAPRANVIDLRVQPRAQAAVITQTPRPIETLVLPIPARNPLPSLTWLLAGGASAALIAGSVLAISHQGPFRVNRVASTPTKTITAPAATVAPTAAAAPPVQAPAPAPAVAGVTSAQMQSVLNTFAAQAGAPVYAIVKDLKTGQSATVASDQTITSASLYTLFVAHGIYRLIDTGKLSLSSNVPGASSNVGDCLAAMITVSDNTCGEAMEAMLGSSKYTPTLAQYGFTHTRFDYPTVTSAGDVATLYERLYNGTLLSPNTSQQFLNLLKDQRVNNRLPQGLPTGTVFAHKTGDVLGFVHDAGIVYGPKTDYLVAVMTGPWNAPGDAPIQFKNLSSKLYTLLNQ